MQKGGMHPSEQIHPSEEVNKKKQYPKPKWERIVGMLLYLNQALQKEYQKPWLPREAAVLIQILGSIAASTKMLKKKKIPGS